MTYGRSFVSATPHAVELTGGLARAASSKLGRDIVALDVSRSLAIADVFLIVTAGNERQAGAIVDAIDLAAGLAGERVLRREGEAEAKWILLDLADVVVHVMSVEDRELYALERIWKDAPRLDLDLDDLPNQVAA